MPRDDDELRLRTLKDAADFLGVSQSQLYRLGIAGDIDLVKIGRNTRVTQASLERYVKNAQKMIPKRKK